MDKAETSTYSSYKFHISNLPANENNAIRPSPATSPKKEFNNSKSLLSFPVLLGKIKAIMRETIITEYVTLFGIILYLISVKELIIKREVAKKIRQ